MDQPNPSPKTNGAADPSRVVLEFPGTGRADLTARIEGQVTEGQLMAAAYFLDLWVQELRAARLAAAPQLAIARGPMPGVPKGH